MIKTRLILFFKLRGKPEHRALPFHTFNSNFPVHHIGKVFRN